MTTSITHFFELRSYDILFGMDWIATHKTKINCYSKLMKCLNDMREEVTLQGKMKHVTIRKSSVLQVKMCSRKWCLICIPSD